jgi:hypothetical protein
MFKVWWYVRQSALACTVMWLEAHAQRHGCSSSARWPTWQMGLAWNSEELRAPCGLGNCPNLLGGSGVFLRDNGRPHIAWRSLKSLKNCCCARQITDDNITRRMRFACQVSEARIQTYAYRIFQNYCFPRQQWLRESTSMLRYTYILCIVWILFHKYYAFIAFIWSTLLYLILFSCCDGVFAYKVVYRHKTVSGATEGFRNIRIVNRSSNRLMYTN